MKFSALVAVVPEDLENDVIDAARERCASGITVLDARGIGNKARKTFFGFTFEGSQRVLLMVLEKRLALEVLKSTQKILMPDGSESQGLVFTLPLEHLGGIDHSQVEKFEEHLKDSI